MHEMKTINCIHVISEPGDMTRYDYLLHRNGPYDFTIAPVASEFKFPQRVDYYLAKAIFNEIDDGNNELLIQEADKHHCNIYTLAEVCSTIILIKEGK